MSNAFDFTKFVPGFDFLKNLTPGANTTSSAANGWVAPTLDPEELEKRIQELKTVHFWLDQNTKAVGATIQALDVQRMTLQTLKGMNLSFTEMAESLKVKPNQPAAEPEQPKAQEETAEKPAPSSSGAVDPSQWWGALTNQFQHIATQTMTDLAQSAAAHAQASQAHKPAATQSPSAKAATSRTAKTARKTTTRRASAGSGAKTAAKSKK